MCVYNIYIYIMFVNLRMQQSGQLFDSFHVNNFKISLRKRFICHCILHICIISDTAQAVCSVSVPLDSNPAGSPGRSIHVSGADYTCSSAGEIKCLHH